MSGLPQDITHELSKICCATCTVVASIVVSLDIVTYNKNYTTVPYFTVNLEKKKKKKKHCESYLVFIKNIKGKYTVNDPGVDPALSVK